MFLTYLSRSGSTFFAKLLDRYRDIGVSLEARIPDGLHHGAIGLTTPEEIPGFLARLYADEKFREWQVPRQALEEELRELRFPVGFNQLLPLLLRMHCAGEGQKVLVFKCGPYINYVERLKELFPAAQFVFMLRDLRAVFASQKRAIDSFHGRPMSGSPVIKALMYKKVCDLLECYRTAAWFHTVKFENLVDNPSLELDPLLEALDVSREMTQSDEGYEARIPPAQKHLHTNVGEPPKPEKKDAWREELTPAEIAVLEHVAGPALERHGYELLREDPKKLSLFLGVHSHWILYLLRCLKHRRRPESTGVISPCYGR